MNKVLVLKKDVEGLRINQELSEWHCLCFGAKEGDGIAWQPLKGNEPNWFWRWMQYIFFGNKWIRKVE